MWMLPVATAIQRGAPKINGCVLCVRVLFKSRLIFPLINGPNVYEMRPAIVSGDAPGQLLADFSPSLVTVSRSFCEVSFSFLKWQVVEHKRRPKVISKIQNGGQKIGK